MNEKIAINTPTGKVGSKLAQRLIDAGDRPVVLLTRDRSKVADLVARGAQVEVGSLDDPRYVERALAGVGTLYWANPFGVGPDGTVLGSFRQLGRIAAAAVVAARVERIVQLSVLDIHPEGGAGDIPAGVAEVEAMLEGAAPHVTHVRATYFMENFMLQLPNIANGCLRMPVSGSTRVPMIASTDVAGVAYDAVVDRSWTGHRAVGAHGPEDLSYLEARDAIARGLGRELGFETISSTEARVWARTLGIPGPVADAVVALYDGFERGAFVPTPSRDAASTTATSLESFARSVLGPALRAAMAA